MTEVQWQNVVTDIARLYGWIWHHHHDSRRSQAGWPDLVLLGHQRALFVELKADKGRLSNSQRIWLAELNAAGLEVAVWRPTDLPEVQQSLGGRQRRLELSL